MSRQPKSALCARRSFLKAVGASAAALPFYRMLEDSVALAASGQLPLRFVGMAAWHGTEQKYYARQPGEDDLSFDISYPDCALRPFDNPEKYSHSFRRKVNILEGFDYGVACNYAAIGGCDISMHGAMGCFLTGSAPTGNAPFGAISYGLQNVSLDQYLAGLYGGATRFRSVELGTEYSSALSHHTLAYGVGGAPKNNLNAPDKVWDQYFASLIVSNDPAALAAAKRRQAIGMSILDYVTADLQRLQVRLAGPEKDKLDQHLTVVRDLENQLKLGTAPPSAGCTQPPRRASTGNANPADNYVVGAEGSAGAPYRDRVTDMNLEMLAQILICDLSRFATFVLPNTGGQDVGTGPYVPALDSSTRMVTAASWTDMQVPADFHLEIAHKTSLTSPPNVQRAVASMNRYYYGKLARLMQRLQDAGILDSTVILMGNEGGQGGPHSIRQVPIVMAGGANGAIRMGRRIVAPGRIARPGTFCASADGRTILNQCGPNAVNVSFHNPILVAVANTFRAAAGDPPITSFGTYSRDPTRIEGVQGLI